MKNNLQETKPLINPESDIVPAKGFQPNEIFVSTNISPLCEDT